MRANLQNAEFIGDKVGSFSDWLGVKMDELPDDYKHLITEKLAEVEQQITSAQLTTYLADSNYKIIVSNTDNGTFVVQHIRAHKSDLKDNINAAKRLSKSGYSVVIQENKLAQNKKNPEFLVIHPEGATHRSDLKTPDPEAYKTIQGGIKNSFRKATEQDLSHVVIDIIAPESLEDIAKGINFAFQKHTQIRTTIILRGAKAVEVKREDYIEGRVLEILKNNL
jgi:hypothetical protein